MARKSKASIRSRMGQVLAIPDGNQVTLDRIVQANMGAMYSTRLRLDVTSPTDVRRHAGASVEFSKKSRGCSSCPGATREHERALELKEYVVPVLPDGTSAKRRFMLSIRGRRRGLRRLRRWQSTR
jgi:hypothetical protein